MLSPFLQCPSKLSGLNESSPRVCKPYLSARSRIEPHLHTFYNSYGVPCVDFARPYVQNVNERVYAPSVEVVKQGYDKYAAPALEQAQKYGYDKVEPLLNVAKDRFDAVYKDKIDPYLQQALSKLQPYWHKFGGQVSDVSSKHIYPVYTQSGPFVEKMYASSRDMLATTVYPYAGGAWSKTVYFVNNSLWPTITKLYSENVEPQLVKIGQKLATYKEGSSRLWPAADESNE